jgi:signal transduction histidine kinase
VYDVTAVLEIISSISSTLALDETLTKFTEKTAQIVGVDGCAISSWDPQNETITVLAEYISPNVAASPDERRRQVMVARPLSQRPVSARVLHEQTPLVIYLKDPLVDEAEQDLLNRLGWEGLLIVPMLYKGQATGLMELYSDDHRRCRFAAEDIPLCQALANQAAVAIEHIRLFQEAQAGQLHAEAMQVIGQALTSELDYQRIVRNVADFAYRLVGAEFVYVAVPETEGFRLVASVGQGNDTAAAVYATDISSDIDSPLDWVIWEKKPLVVADFNAPPSNLAAWVVQSRSAGWQAMVAVPLLSYNRLIGVLVAYARQAYFFNPDDIAILKSLASQAAVAIQNAQLFAEREAQREALHQLSLRLINAQEEERRRISRELHDELGQALTALKINLDVARRALPADAPTKLQRSISEASLLAVHTLETARNLSLELHPAILDDLGLVAALRWEVDRYAQRTGQSVNFEVDLAGVGLEPELEITIYRIVTEALTNVARHAQASHILLDLHIENNHVVARISDDGIGFDPVALFNTPVERRTLGLTGMRERTELLDGEFTLISEPGHGATIQVKLPLAS